MQIRRVSPEDWEPLRDIRLRALQDAPDAFGSTYAEESLQDEEGWRRFATGWAGTAQHAVFVAEGRDGRWVGLAVGSVPEEEPTLAHLFAMWVDPAERGAGVGPALVGSVAGWAVMVGATRIELRVTEGNEAATRLYERAGFVDVGERLELRVGSGVWTRTLRRSLAPGEGRTDALLAEQVRYYEDRAPAYEDLYLRRGTFDRGPDFNARWFEETGALERSLEAFGPRGAVLELACGNGIWTRLLAPVADRLVALDASPTMLARNAELVGDPSVEYVQADVFTWSPPGGETFDALVFGFFLSHVPPDRFAAFWERVRAWLTPGGRVWFCDDAAGPGRPYSGDTVEELPFANRRRLEGGREYEIVKLFWEPEDLTRRLQGLGWQVRVDRTGEHFLHAVAAPLRSAPTRS